MMQPNPPSRNIILCFDGTGNMFGENSNVIRFCSALIKTQPDRQLIYYQPGIGTYNERTILSSAFSAATRILDSGIAINLDVHVKEGYQFIMRNYRPGDKICLFGFSRGAHTARVVAGMLYKVGLLLPHNDQQLDFAFTAFQSTGPHGIQLSKDFKKTFSVPVVVEFLGVWDTVSSVGIIPRGHPYTSINYSTKTVRHALALDERRSRFRPQTWYEPSSEHEQDLDVDDPQSIIKPRGNIPRDQWVYQPPARSVADVKEVWFAGAHSDVGGGSHSNAERDSLSYIPLRWMIAECMMNKSGILFSKDVLESFGYDGPYELQDDSALDTPVVTNGYADLNSQHTNVTPSPGPPHQRARRHLMSRCFLKVKSLKGWRRVSVGKREEPLEGRARASMVLPPDGQLYNVPTAAALTQAERRNKYLQDCLARIFDHLVLPGLQRWGWWILEWIPTFTTYQLPNGVWMRKRMANAGRGRYIPFHDNKILVHHSVKDRIEEKKRANEIDKRVEVYTPSAHNWCNAIESGMVQWV